VIIVGGTANCAQSRRMPERELSKDRKRLVSHLGVGVALERPDDSGNDIGHAHLRGSTSLAGQAVESDLAYRRHRIVQRRQEDRSGLVGRVMVEEIEAAASNPGVFVAQRPRCISATGIPLLRRRSRPRLFVASHRRKNSCTTAASSRVTKRKRLRPRTVAATE
jgi:hypothetical protein